MDITSIQAYLKILYGDDLICKDSRDQGPFCARHYEIYNRYTESVSKHFSRDLISSPSLYNRVKVLLKAYTHTLFTRKAAMRPMVNVSLIHPRTSLRIVKSTFISSKYSTECLNAFYRMYVFFLIDLLFLIIPADASPST
jgi:hypothetical protein